MYQDGLVNPHTVRTISFPSSSRRCAEFTTNLSMEEGTANQEAGRRGATTRYCSSDLSFARTAPPFFPTHGNVMSLLSFVGCVIGVSDHPITHSSADIRAVLVVVAGIWPCKSLVVLIRAAMSSIKSWSVGTKITHQVPTSPRHPPYYQLESRRLSMCRNAPSHTYQQSLW